jgi:hypothetical protein
MFHALPILHDICVGLTRPIVSCGLLHVDPHTTGALIVHLKESKLFLLRSKFKNWKVKNSELKGRVLYLLSYCHVSICSWCVPVYIVLRAVVFVTCVPELVCVCGGGMGSSVPLNFIFFILSETNNLTVNNNTLCFATIGKYKGRIMSWVQKLLNKILCQLLRNRRYYYLQLILRATGCKTL